MSVEVRFYEAALVNLLKGPNGEVARDLSRRAVAVTSRAKQIATAEPKVQTGRYRSSIAWRLGADLRGLYAEVGSSLAYAIFIEEGTPPHEIRPSSKRALAWKGGRHPVKRVMHPGTKAYRVLQRALEAAR